MIHDTQSAQISEQDGRNIYAVIKTMCPPNLHLQILHEQIGFQRFILGLNAAKVTFFISCGMEFQILSPKYDTDCLSYVSVLT